MKKYHPSKKVLDVSQNAVWGIGVKLESLGVLLEHQASGDDGVPELMGLGLTLRDLSEELLQTSSALENFSMQLE